MDKIQGVSFESWAAACGQLMQGMDEATMRAKLGIDESTWAQVNEAWAGKLGELMAEDMSLATTYGQIFANPNVAEFADASAPTPAETVESKVPDFETFQKIFIHQSIGSEHGEDPATILHAYGLSLGEWSQASQHWSAWMTEQMSMERADHKERYDEFGEIRQRWESHWNDHYA